MVSRLVLELGAKLTLIGSIAMAGYGGYQSVKESMEFSNNNTQYATEEFLQQKAFDPRNITKLEEIIAGEQGLYDAIQLIVSTEKSEYSEEEAQKILDEDIFPRIRDLLDISEDIPDPEVSFNKYATVIDSHYKHQYMMEGGITMALLLVSSGMVFGNYKRLRSIREEERDDSKKYHPLDPEGQERKKKRRKQVRKSAISLGMGILGLTISWDCAKGIWDMPESLCHSYSYGSHIAYAAPAEGVDSTEDVVAIAAHEGAHYFEHQKGIDLQIWEGVSRMIELKTGYEKFKETGRAKFLEDALDREIRELKAIYSTSCKKNMITPKPEYESSYDEGNAEYIAEDWHALGTAIMQLAIHNSNDERYGKTVYELLSDNKNAEFYNLVDDNVYRFQLEGFKSPAEPALEKH